MPAGRKTAQARRGKVNLEEKRCGEFRNDRLQDILARATDRGVISCSGLGAVALRGSAARPRIGHCAGRCRCQGQNRTIRVLTPSPSTMPSTGARTKPIPSAEMTVRTDYRKETGKKYTILSQSGSGFIVTHVLGAILDSEKQHQSARHPRAFMAHLGQLSDATETRRHSAHRWTGVPCAGDYPLGKRLPI